MEAKKHLYEDEHKRFESERIQLRTKIDRLRMEVSNAQNKITEKDRKIAEVKKVSRSYFEELAKNSILKDTIASQKKRIHSQEFYVDKNQKLTIEMNTWRTKFKAGREEVCQLNEQVSKLLGEKNELKKKVKTIKCNEKLMASVGSLEDKAKEYFDKMLNALGEVQALRDRLTRAKERNAELKCKLEDGKDLVENAQLDLEKACFRKAVEAQRNLLWSQLCEFSRTQQDSIDEIKRKVAEVENLRKREKWHTSLLKRNKDFILVLWAGTIQKYLEFTNVPAIKQKPEKKGFRWLVGGEFG